MQLAQIQPKKMEVPQTKGEKMREALEKGLKTPWMGLRPDLVLHKGAPNEMGEPTYVLEDPVRGEHFELGEPDAKFFLCLAAETDVKLAVDRLMKTTSFRPSVKDTLSFIQMLQKEKLAILPEGAELDDMPDPEDEDEDDEDEKRGIIRRFFGFILLIFKYIWWWLERFRGGEAATKPPPGQKKKDEKAEKKGGGFKLSDLRSIYFFKIPITRPDTFLTALHPWVSPIWSKPFLYVYGVLGLTGLIFALQQADLYWSTVSYLFTFKGALIFSLCLLGLKIMHEFGHAFAAKHYGIFVRRMGIYMMFFMPMLYTDATEAWKLPSKKARLMIGAAGVIVEIYVGMIALFFWSILPDGILRSLMFYTSGAALISTLLVNVSPFMRFDGYYVLMDYLGMSSLRARSSQMYKYYVRKVLVDWTGPKPEEHPKGPFMAIFGMGCTLYLIVVIFGIQIMIYQEVSELLAIWSMIILGLVFVVGPVVKEIGFLLKSRENWGTRRNLLIRGLILALIGAYLFVPVQKSEMIPALFLYRDVAKVNIRGAGQIISDIPEEGMRVDEGDLLLQIRNAQMAHGMGQLQFQLLQSEETLKSVPSGGISRKLLLAQRRQMLTAKEKLRLQLDQLEIRSPLSGRVVYVNEQLDKGYYVSGGYACMVADNRFFEVQAYVPENIYRKLKGKEDEIASLEVVIPDLETERMTAKFREMLDFPVSEFPNNSLFDIAGGPIVLSKVSKQPLEPQFPIIFDIPRPAEYLPHGTPCFVKIKGETISMMGRIVREVYRVLATRKIISTFQ